MPKATFGSVAVVAAALAYPITKTSEMTYPNSLSRVLPVSVLLWAIYKFLLYPNLFSPLRHITTVDGGKWWSSESLRLYRGKAGEAQAHWVDTVPHKDGLLRYRTYLNSEQILVTGTEALAELLVTKNYDFVKPERVISGLQPVVGMGILLTEGDVHKSQRKTLMPAFSFRHIKDLYSPMWAMTAHATDALMHDVAAAKGDFVVDISEWASSVTLGIICVTGLGADMEGVLNKDRSYTALRDLYKQVFKQDFSNKMLFLLRVFVLPHWIVQYLPFERNRAAASLRKECKTLIRQRKEELENGITDESEKNILTIALANGGFSDEELVDQLLTFLGAGHETTATALSWAIYALSTRPEMQARLREEIRAHLPPPSSSGLPSTQELAATIDSQMPYLSAFCQEVLRFFSPVSITYRKAAVDTTLQGHEIPKGTSIAISPHATNRDGQYWGEDAKTFNPERFMTATQNGKQDHDKADSAASQHRSNYATLTFLHGPRSCIGERFSKAEMAILVANLVGRFEFALADETQADMDTIPQRRGATNRPLHGLNVKTKLIDGW